MNGRRRLNPNVVAHLIAAEAEYRPAPPPTLPSVEELRQQHEALKSLRKILEAEPLGAAHLAWKWRAMSGIAAELDQATVKLLQRAGAVR